MQRMESQEVETGDRNKYLDAAFGTMRQKMSQPQPIGACSELGSGKHDGEDWSRACPFDHLPDEALAYILTFTKYLTLGKVCKRWERLKVTLQRDKAVGLFMEKSQLPEALSREIEGELFSSSGHIIGGEYKAVLRRLLHNLKEKTHPELRRMVLSGEMPAGRVVCLSPSELLTRQEAARQDAAAREFMKSRTVTGQEADGRAQSTEYTCPRCQCEKTWVRKWRRKPIVDRYRLIITCQKCDEQWEG